MWWSKKEKKPKPEIRAAVLIVSKEEIIKRMGFPEGTQIVGVGLDRGDLHDIKFYVKGQPWPVVPEGEIAKPQRFPKEG